MKRSILPFVIGAALMLIALGLVGASKPTAPDIKTEPPLSIVWDTGISSRPVLDWTKIEYGLRSDGVIVWRKKTKTP